MLNKIHSPLLRQIVGGIAGAAVALVLYETYSFASVQLQALVTVPTAPNMQSEETTRFSYTELDPARDRLVRKIQRATDAMAKADPSTVERDRMNQQTIVRDGGAALNPATMPMPSWFTTTSSSSVAPAFIDGGTVHEQGPGAVINPEPAAAPVEIQVPQIADTVAPAWIGTGPLPDIDYSVTEVAPEPVVLEPVAAPMMATMNAKSGKLPQSGFGLDIIAAMTAGVVIGRKKMKKKSV